MARPAVLDHDSCGQTPNGIEELLLTLDPAMKPVIVMGDAASLAR